MTDKPEGKRSARLFAFWIGLLAVAAGALAVTLIKWIRGS